mmetsp:Transcript_49397/g.92355  ORF Transcript_49397/g.92355 Transcript_49397/m.92355 type:complete len:255 (+) Transcript_49397:292-1056(+)
MLFHEVVESSHYRFNEHASQTSQEIREETLYVSSSQGVDLAIWTCRNRCERLASRHGQHSQRAKDRTFAQRIVSPHLSTWLCTLDKCGFATVLPPHISLLRKCEQATATWKCLGASSRRRRRRLRKATGASRPQSGSRRAALQCVDLARGSRQWPIRQNVRRIVIRAPISAEVHAAARANHEDGRLRVDTLKEKTVTLRVIVLPPEAPWMNVQAPSIFNLGTRHMLIDKICFRHLWLDCAAVDVSRNNNEFTIY